jgi:PBSX family phage terminase large subunit
MSRWKFSPKAKRFLASRLARINILHGSVRSGKTVVSLIRWALWVRTEAPEGDLLMFGKTERTVKRNVLGPLKQIVGSKNFRYVEGKGELWLYGRLIYVLGANDERAEGNLRGMTLAGAYGDEATLIPEGFWQQLLARLSVPGAKVFATTNPDSPYHWLKVNYIDRAGLLDVRVWHFTLEDNPALDRTYVANLMREYVGLWFKRFIQGLWVYADGAVYDFFDEEAHTRDSIEGEVAWRAVAVDYGTSNATVFGLFAVSKSGPVKAWLEREYHYSGRDTGSSKTDDEYVRDFLEWLGDTSVRYVLLDPSAASFKAALRRKGFQVRDANNDVIDGIRTQGRMLKSGEYKVLSACKQTIRDYGAYLWDKRAQERGEDKPLKQNDHTKDCERYFLHSTFGKPMTATVRPPVLR